MTTETDFLCCTTNLAMLNMYRICTLGVTFSCFVTSAVCECGRPTVQPLTGTTSIPQLIVRGNVAVPHSWPWQVELLYKDYPAVDSWGGLRGGSIITPYHILTAAKGFVGISMDPKTWRVLIGAHNISKFSTDYKVVNVAYVEIHEEYKTGEITNDIAILTLTEPIEFGDNILDVCLTDTDFNAGTECFVTGWGRISLGNNDHSDVLKQAKVFLIPGAVCNLKSLGTDLITCAYNERAQEGACGRDGGGPSVCQDGKGVWYQQGVTSMGDCGFGPGIYTRVPRFYRWIERKIRMSK